MQIHEQADKMEFDPETAEQVESRLEEIRTLERKYGNSIADILRYQEDAEKEIAQLSQQEQDSSQLDKRFSQLSRELYDACMRLHELRQNAAERFSAAVEEQLKDLGMAKARLHVDFAKIPAFDQAE